MIGRASRVVSALVSDLAALAGLVYDLVRHLPEALPDAERG